MNRRREDVKTPIAVFVAVILSMVTTVYGGVMYAYYKNRQIQLAREIDATEKYIEHCGLQVRTVEMHMDQLLNRFVIRKQLEKNGSQLKPISLSVVEDMDIPQHLKNRQDTN